MIDEFSRAVSMPISAPGQRLAFERVQVRVRDLERELRLLIPEPRRQDIWLKLHVTAVHSQMLAEIHMVAAPQVALGLDEVSAMPIKIAIARELADLEHRIREEHATILARLDDEHAPALSPRQEKRLKVLHHHGVQLDLPTGPVYLAASELPAPIDGECRLFRMRVYGHYRRSLMVTDIIDMAEGSALRTPAGGRIPLLLETANSEEQVRLHRAVGELFSTAGGDQIEVQARVQLSPVTQKPARLIFEQLI
ncbi:hypothetical protein [Thauera sp. AutoDN2]|uniref:hypothetical protein n=1 Tax=Thauera sp. AutoDN2 TaxID=3416051 RepID=UPI003F4BB421